MQDIDGGFTATQHSVPQHPQLLGNCQQLTWAGMILLPPGCSGSHLVTSKTMPAHAQIHLQMIGVKGAFPSTSSAPQGSCGPFPCSMQSDWLICEMHIRKHRCP